MGLFSKKKKTGDDGDGGKAHPFQDPKLNPGYFGQFPLTFSFYFLGQSQDRKTKAFLFADFQNGQIRPLNAITVNNGMVKVQVMLHAGRTRDTPVIGLAGTEKMFRSASVLGVPAFGAAQDGSVQNQVVNLVDKGGIRAEKWQFSVPVGASGQVETFEWRGDDEINPPKDRPLERRLVRLATSQGGADDIVARWTNEPVPEEQSRLGTVQFIGTGATGELGPYWMLVATMSLLRVVQIKSEVMVVAEGMEKAANRLALTGIAFSF